MHFGATSWSLSEADNAAIGHVLQRFLFDSNARCALVVDRSGQLVTTSGDRPPFDVTAFATLAAADFSANDQLARLIGERDFNTLFHQGEKESMLLADVARRVILVVLFDNRTTLGMVRLKMRGTVEELTRLFERMFTTAAARPVGQAPALLADVDDEIDRLFQ
ncbi:MAG: roadblock/LC7 domain-containing protein [Cytophagaceae bacterium]|nr:roadblock/LC7 domain-containing protein [Gemmatimonadaceae bacterium]